MEHGRDKFRKLDGGGAVVSAGMPEPFIDQQGLNQNRSVYLSLFHRDPSAFQASSPLYKVKVQVADSDEAVAGAGASSGRETLHRMCDLETNMGGKTFVTLQSGWIVGIGGNPGSTIIFDTKRRKVIQGPNLVASKLNPVAAAVGDRIYALASAPDYLRDPNFVPWFEVLDLSNPLVTKGADGVLCLDSSCFWKALPYPALFPSILTPMDFRDPPFITVRSYVVVGHYILVSLNQPSNCVFAFDANSEEWHKIVGEYLPFVGAATPHGIGSNIFLAFSHEDGPIKAYRIRASSASSTPSEKDWLSITVITIRDKEQFEVGVGGGCRCISLDREHFSVLFWYEGHGRYLIYDTKTEDTYPRKLYLKLVTYRTESPVLQGETPEILISSQWEHNFRVCSSLGFSSAPIAFALSI